MSNPSGPDRPDDASEATTESVVESDQTQPAEAVTDPVHEPATEILLSPEAEAQLPTEASDQAEERRFTAPSGFDGSTQRIDRPADPATEVMPPVPGPKPVAPQLIPPRMDAPKPPRSRRSWGWVVALLLVIAALVAVAILGTVLLTKGSTPKASEQDKVRTTIQNYDAAVQKGDLATLRSITCGTTRDSYVNYDEQAWKETHSRVAAAKQYPVVASVDQVVVNGDHAEANITTFMAYAPQTRSTRSLDLQFRDDQWKICQAPDS
jgi:hypothetical protein